METCLQAKTVCFWVEPHRDLKRMEGQTNDSMPETTWNLNKTLFKNN